MVGNGFQRFREFSLLVRCLVQVFVLRSAVGRLKRLINGIDRSVLLVLYQCGGIVSIPCDFPAFVVQDVLHVGFLSEGGIKKNDLISKESLFSLQFCRFLTDFSRLVFRFAGNGFRLGFGFSGLLCKLTGQFGQTGSELVEPFAGLLYCGRQELDYPPQLCLHHLDLLGNRLGRPTHIFDALLHFLVNVLYIGFLRKLAKNFPRFGSGFA